MPLSILMLHRDEQQGSSCPRLGLAGGPGSPYAMPCTLNMCHADPLRRKGPYDLPLTCQADLCLSSKYRSCPYWRSREGDRISLVGFIARQMLAVYAICARALQP